MKYFVKHMLLWNWFYVCSITSNLLFYVSVFPYFHLLGVTGISGPPPLLPRRHLCRAFHSVFQRPSHCVCLRPCFVVFTLFVAVSFIAFCVCSIVCAFCLGSIVLVFFFVHVFCVSCLASRRWSIKCRKLLLNMRSDCGRRSWYRGCRTDVGCYGETVHLLGRFSRHFSFATNWRLNSWRTWVSSRVGCRVTSASVIWRGPQTPLVMTDLVFCFYLIGKLGCCRIFGELFLLIGG